MSRSSRKVPQKTTDTEAEAFLDQDLSDLDSAPLKPADWGIQPKTERINMRVLQALVDALNAKTETEGIPYQHLIRQAI